MKKIKGRKLLREKKRKYYRIIGITVAALIVVLILLGVLARNKSKDEAESAESKPLTQEELLEQTAKENGYSVDEYPQELIELMEKNPETEEFVLNYPLKKDTYSNENLTELDESEGIPLLIQWDDRWGYYQYGGNVMGLAGCGPTCLSMVASYLFDNPALTPIYMADYATREGHSIEGGGTAWSLMNEGARNLGLNPKEVPLDENVVRQHLENGRPIICNVGEGIFTDNGHYLVFSGWEDGKIKINDPNRREYSERLWAFEEISDQIKNMWVY